MGGVTVHWAMGRVRAHMHACATATIMASSLRQTLNCRSHVRFLPPFFYGWLRIVRFQRPLVLDKNINAWTTAAEAWLL